MTLADVQRINALSKKWTVLNHLDSFVALGNKNYLFIKDIIENYKIPYTAVLVLLTDEGLVGSNPASLTDKFKSGGVVINEDQKQRVVYYLSCIAQYKI
jgi:hypothetical protein